MAPPNPNELPCGYDPLRDRWEKLKEAGIANKFILAVLGNQEEAALSPAEAAEEWWNSLTEEEVNSIKLTSHASRGFPKPKVP